MAATSGQKARRGTHQNSVSVEQKDLKWGRAVKESENICQPRNWIITLRASFSQAMKIFGVASLGSASAKQNLN